MRARYIIIIAVLAIAAAAPVGAQCQYTVKTWPQWQCAWEGGRIYTAHGFNNHGDWAGYRTMCYPEEGEGTLAIFCLAGGTPQVLPMPPGAGPNGAKAYDVNDSGVIVGRYFRPPYNLDTACIWWPNGEITVLPPTDPNGSSQAWAINNSNVVVGQLDGLPFIWENGVVTLIQSPPGLGGGIGRDVSDSGFVTGRFGGPNLADRAFRWKAGVTTVLDPAGGHVACEGRSVNSQGVVVGSSSTYLGLTLGYATISTAWSIEGMSVPPILPGYSNGWCAGINDSSVIVGCSANAPGGAPNTKAVIWVDGVVYDLNLLVAPGSLTLSAASLINNAGQLLVTGGVRIGTPINPPTVDLNGDCKVDGADLGKLIDEWGKPNSIADLDHDGIVDGRDLGLLLGGWAP